MGENALAVEVRDGLGKGVARKLRVAKRIPAVLYGRGKPSVSVSLDPSALEKLLRSSSAGLNTLIDLDVAGRRGPRRQGRDREGAAAGADPRRARSTPTSTRWTSPRPSRSRSRSTSSARSVGVSMNGGILDTALREIDIECLPRAIPSAIEVDVTALDVGESIHVRDLVVPAGVTILSDRDLSVVSVVLPAAEEAAPVVEAVAEGEAAAGAAAPAEAAGGEEKKGKEKE